MALFRCASGTSGGGATITVTYSADFYGETITCSNGVKTYSKVAPNTGTVDFNVDEEGTWTISCTIGADTYSTTAEVDLSYSATLEALPNGSTVTPTDDVETWLACAGIKDKAYTTLSQVLSDSETFNALLGDSNACAYMARSTTWALLNEGEVPAMTSATTPSGTVTQSDYNASYGIPYKAFDDDWDKTATPGNVNSWYCNDNENEWLAYEFTSAKSVRKIKLRAGIQTGGSGYIGVKNFKIQYSDDGTNWTDEGHTFTYQGTSGVTPTAQTFLLDDVGSHTHWRIYVIDNYSPTASFGLCVGNLQFYTDVDFTTNQYAMNLLGQYDTACDALLSDATWASAIANSTYWESVLQPLVPIMTSNTTPSGECSDDTSSNDAYKAFDNNGSTYYFTQTNSAGDWWLQYEFPANITISKIIYTADTGSNGIDSYNGKLQAYISNEWVDVLDDVYFEKASSTEKQRSFASRNTGIIRVLASRKLYNSKYNSALIKSLQFYGRTTSSEKIHGGNPTYDSFYRIVDGNNVPVTDPSLLDAGTYTIYSNGLAKNPFDLSADYGKTVRICPNTREILVRPDIAPYWFGSKLCNFVGTPYIPASGWDTCSGSVSEQSTYVQVTCNFSSGAGMYALRTDRSFAFNGSQKLKAHIYDSSDTQYGNMDAKANISSNLAENGVSWTNNAVSETSALTAGSYYPYVAKRHGSSASSAKLDMLFIE